MQKNWIGKSFGCEINFKLKEYQLKKLNVLQQDLILYLVFFFSISVDHPLSKFYENDKEF